MDERQMTLMLHQAVISLKRAQQQLLRKGEKISETDAHTAVHELTVVTKNLERILREL